MRERASVMFFPLASRMERRLCRNKDSFRSQVLRRSLSALRAPRRKQCLLRIATDSVLGSMTGPRGHALSPRFATKINRLNRPYFSAITPRAPRPFGLGARSFLNEIKRRSRLCCERPIKQLFGHLSVFDFLLFSNSNVLRNDLDDDIG